MSLGRLGTIEQAVLFIRPVNTTYDYITPLPKALYLYTESGSSALADSYNQTLNGNLQIDYQFHENTYYSFDITSFLKSQLGTYDNYKNFLILRLSDTDYQNTVQRLVIGDREHTLHFDAGVHGTQTIFSRIELQIFYTIYDDPAN
jgi:hypothetical protein